MLIVVDRGWSQLIMQTRDKKGCATCNRGRLNIPQSILWPDTILFGVLPIRLNEIKFGIEDSWEPGSIFYTSERKSQKKYFSTDQHFNTFTKQEPNLIMINFSPKQIALFNPSARSWPPFHQISQGSKNMVHCSVDMAVGLQIWPHPR